MQMEWFDHSGQIVHAISELLELHSLIDVTLAADGKQIKVHRLILAAASDYFRVSEIQINLLKWMKQ